MLHCSSMLIALKEGKKENKKQEKHENPGHGEYSHFNEDQSCSKEERIQVFFESLLARTLELHSVRVMGRLLHSIGAALEKARTPQSTFVCLSVNTWDSRLNRDGVDEAQSPVHVT